MAIDLARTGSWLQGKLNRVSEKYLTVGGVVRFAMTSAAFLAVTLWPTFRAMSLQWTSWDNGWSKALKIAWIPLVAGIYLKYSDAIKRYRAWDKLQGRKRISRQIMTGRALKELCVCLRNPPADAQQKIKDIRERILHSAALGIEELLGSGSSTQVVATLLEFSDETRKKMKVVARSEKTRVTGHEYACEELLGWICIKEARIQVVDDVTTDPRFRHLGKKPYRAVAAVPVGFGGKAVATLSIDSNEPHAFYGRADAIAVQLEPYAATLALTYATDAVYHDCNYEPSNSP